MMRKTILKKVDKEEFEQMLNTMKEQKSNNFVHLMNIVRKRCLTLFRGI